MRRHRLHNSARKRNPRSRLTDERLEIGPKNLQTVSGKLDAASLPELVRHFPLPWSHDIQLLKVDNPEARAFYEAEALRNGWSVRQLERQITTLFYERTLASRNKAAMLRKGQSRGRKTSSRPRRRSRIR